MAGVFTKMNGSGEKSIASAAAALKNEINAELVAESRRIVGNASVVLLSFEKYYMRNSSYASLTVMLTESDGQQTADIIGSGGGEGIFNISWGANSDFADTAERILLRYGFR